MFIIAVIIPTMYTKHTEVLLRSISSVLDAVKPGMALNILLVVNKIPVGTSSTAITNEISRKVRGTVDVIGSYTNKGFAQAVNDGIIYAKTIHDPDWYLILNDDANIDKNFFVRLMPQLMSDTYDAVSCAINTTKGKKESVGLQYFSTGLAFPRQKPIEIGELSLFSGTCVLLSKKRVEKELNRYGHVFNPLFFAYAEDLELSLRILRDGGKIYISNDTLVIHEGSQTAKRGSFFQLYHGYRNLVLVVLLLWSWPSIFWRLPLLLVGQVYIFAMSVYKGYWVLYPKLWRWVGKHWKIILWQRRSYDTR